MKITSTSGNLFGSYDIDSRVESSLASQKYHVKIGKQREVINSVIWLLPQGTVLHNHEIIRFEIVFV